MGSKASLPRNESASSLMRPLTSESQASELEFSFVISRLLFLKHRVSLVTNGSYPGADLVSCGGGGWVRFWSTSKAMLMSEFIAHPHAGNVIATTDAEDQYLVTADSDGAMKIWNIAEYLLDEPSDTITSPPPTVASWQAHADCINSVCVCSRNNRLLIISASSDCSVALWDISGRRIGEFGQEEHWKLGDIDSAAAIEEEEDLESQHVDDSLFKDFDITEIELESRASTAPERPATSHEFDSGFRANTWQSTVLGKAYQEGRMNKRERKQPSTVPGYRDYIEESAVGPYGVLTYTDLEVMPVMRKPDFMLHPHKYFGEKSASKHGRQKAVPSNEQPEEPQTLMEARHTLKAAFDEKTLFPKELLDFEAQIRTEHAQRMKSSAHNVLRKLRPTGILKAMTSNSNLNAPNPLTPNTVSVGSKVNSRVGSSTQPTRQMGLLRNRSSNLNLNEGVGAT